MDPQQRLLLEVGVRGGWRGFFFFVGLGVLGWRLLDYFLGEVWFGLVSSLGCNCVSLIDVSLRVLCGLFGTPLPAIVFA